MSILPLRFFFACFLCALLSLQCESERIGVEDVPGVEDFSKSERERLGNLLHLAIVQQQPLLPQIVPFDSTVYPFLEQMHKQATLSLQRDVISIASDRWSPTRPWRLIILDLPEASLFAAPGGYTYISTGLLAALDSEHQLFALLAFEAISVQEGLALQALLDQFGSLAVRDFIRNAPDRFTPSASEMVAFLQNWQMPTSQIQQIDNLLATFICEQSVYRPTGVPSALALPDALLPWRTLRSYSDRANNWPDSASNCGSISTTGSYILQVRRWL